MQVDYGSWAARWRVPLGFIFAVAYIVLSQPTRALLITGCAVALAGILLRAAAAGYIEKNQALATGGPFRYSRNPLYLGTLILGAGFMVAGGSWILGVTFIVLFVLIYVPVMRREESFLLARFGPAFSEYAGRVPLLFPIPGRSAAANGVFKWRLYRKNREYEAACGWLAISVFLAIKLVLR